MSSLESRLSGIERRLNTAPCHTCYGAAYAVVFVPQGADEKNSEYCPTHCRECGIPLRVINRIIGISEAEMFPEPAERRG